jgi:hypothetical protein
MDTIFSSETLAFTGIHGVTRISQKTERFIVLVVNILSPKFPIDVRICINEVFVYDCGDPN